MKKISKITVTSKKESGGQILNDRLTPTEKKILIYMLNADMKEGSVRNKVFKITKTGKNTATVIVGTITKSIVLGRKELTKFKVQIKYS